MSSKHKRGTRRILAIVLLAACIGIAGLVSYACTRGETAETVVQDRAVPATPALPEGAPAGQPFLHIDKQTMTLTAYRADGSVQARFGVCTGKGYGNKRRRGDMKTPEGVFSIQQIQDASSWTHDFGDGLGVIEGAYGPWFLRLRTPGHSGIGIHGTHKPASIGTRDSEGCIRLANENIDSLRHMVAVGETVIITPGDADRQADSSGQP